MAGKLKKFYLAAPSTITDVTAETDDALCDFADGSAEAWLEACVVDATFDGSWEEEDVTDTCSNNIMEAAPTVRGSSITFDAFKKLTGAGAIPVWYTTLRTAWRDAAPVIFLMLDDDRTNAGADGVYLVANVFDFKLSHPTKGSNKVEFSAKSAGTITGVQKYREITRLVAPP